MKTRSRPVKPGYWSVSIASGRLTCHPDVPSRRTGSPLRFCSAASPRHLKQSIDRANAWRSGSAKDTAINGLVEAGVIAARAGKVRRVRRDELAEDWNPAADRRLTIWETTQHLIRRLDQQGESGAAALMHQLGGMAEIARDLA